MNSEKVKAVCRNMANGQDIFQDVVLAFLELEDDKAIQIHQGGYLEWWCIRVAMNLNSNTGKIGKHLNRNREVFGAMPFLLDRRYYEIEGQIDAAINLEKIQKELDEMYWYDRELFKIYLSEGSLRKSEQATGIPYVSIKVTVDKVRKKLKKKCGY
jgi:hypothetical protein